jgi:hypothetical protein
MALAELGANGAGVIGSDGEVRDDRVTLPARSVTCLFRGR